jgi:RHH-type rel operon transcriptional repressor/antitoxin RelB
MAGLFISPSKALYSYSMLAIRLPEDIEKRLDDLARSTGRTKTFYAREAILEHLKEVEDIYLVSQQPAPTPAPFKKVDPGNRTSGAPSFVDRWKGRFQPAGKPDERYTSLAKKYL